MNKEQYQFLLNYILQVFYKKRSTPIFDSTNAISERHPAGFQFSFIGPIFVGLFFLIAALRVQIQILEEKINALEKKYSK